jgi:6,7-dimethyl-8-ribityllumazine synthase
LTIEHVEIHGTGSDLTIGVVASTFNQAITDRLLEGALKELQNHQVGRIVVLKVPGAWELAVAAQTLARGGCDAVVAVGAVIKGETDHYEVIVRESAAGLSRAALDTEVPITNAVLAVNTYQQALDRSQPGPGNKGSEAAAAAVEMAGRLRSWKK